VAVDQRVLIVRQQIATNLGLLLLDKGIVNDVGNFLVDRLAGDVDVSGMLRVPAPLRPERLRISNARCQLKCHGQKSDRCGGRHTIHTTSKGQARSDAMGRDGNTVSNRSVNAVYVWDGKQVNRGRSLYLQVGGTPANAPARFGISSPRSTYSPDSAFPLPTSAP